MLKRITLKNICQHEDLTIELGAGLTVITGPQGSGKTNLLSLAIASVVGENLLYGNKSDNVRRGITKKISYVETHWELEGRRYRIVRYYAGGTSKLYIDDKLEESVRGESAITDFMCNLFQTTKQRLLEFSFVQQGKTDALIVTKPTDRVRSVAAMLGVERLLKLEMEAVEIQRQVESQLTRDYAADLRSVLSERANAIAESVRVRRELADLAAAKASAVERLESVRDTLDALARYNDCARKLMECDQTCESLAASISPLYAEIMNANARIADFEQKLSIRESAVEVQRRNARRVELTNLISHIKERIVTYTNYLQPPEEVQEPLISVADVEIWECELSRLTSQLAFMRSGKSICESCGTVVKSDKSRLAELESEVDSLRSRALETRSLWRSRDVFLTAKARYDQFKDGWQSELDKSNRDLLQAVTELSEIGEALEHVDAVEFHFTESQLKHAITQATRQKAEAEVNLEVTTREHTRKLEELNQLTSLRDSLPKVDSEVAAVANAYNRHLQEVESGTTSRLVYLGRLQQTLADCRKLAKQLIRGYREQRPLVRQRELVQNFVKACRPKVVPRAAMVTMLRGIGAQLTEMCAELGQPFVVTIGEELDFMIQHPDGSVEPAQRLSGGQRACLATVFWLTRLMVLNREFPVLALDEPTANMDADAVQNFGALLLRLGDVLRQNGKQVILTTHHQQLASCASSHFHLGAL